MSRKNTYWIKGAFAYRQRIAECPYPEGSHQERDWLAGWRSAHEKDVLRGKAVPLSVVQNLGVDGPDKAG